MAEKDNDKKPKNRRQAVAHRAKHKTKAEFGGFVEFMRTQGVVGLAIGFIIGAQAKVLVDTLNASFINPLLNLFVGGGDSLSGQVITITLGDNSAVFAWGQFVFVLINFIITAAIVYFTFKLLRLDKLDKKKE